MDFRGLGVIFTESVRIDCSFLAYHGGSAKYQTCLVFHRPSPTLDPDLGSTHLVTVVVSVVVIVCCCHSHFPFCHILLQSCLEALVSLS